MDEYAKLELLELLDDDDDGGEALLDVVEDDVVVVLFHGVLGVKECDHDSS